MPTAQILGAELYYERHGEGPPLVFAHALSANHLAWWQQVPHFRQHYTCITFDHPGFGQSGQPPGDDWSFVDCLAGLLEELGIERVSLVAQSMGGGTCLGYTLRHPERVTALVMADTILPLELPEFGDWRLGGGPRRAELLARGILPSCGERMAREQPALHFLYQQLGALNPSWSVDRPPPGSVRVPAAGHAELRGYATPTLFIIGEEDASIPPQILELGAAAVPGARVARVPHAGHSVYFERAAEFNRLVDEFLADVAG